MQSKLVFSSYKSNSVLDYITTELKKNFPGGFEQRSTEKKSSYFFQLNELPTIAFLTALAEHSTGADLLYEHIDEEKLIAENYYFQQGKLQYSHRYGENLAYHQSMRSFVHYLIHQFGKEESEVEGLYEDSTELPLEQALKHYAKPYSIREVEQVINHFESIEDGVSWELDRKDFDFYANLYGFTKTKKSQWTIRALNEAEQELINHRTNVSHFIVHHGFYYLAINDEVF